MGSLADNLENILKPCALGGHAGPLPIDVGALLHMNQAASGVSHACGAGHKGLLILSQPSVPTSFPLIAASDA